MKVLFTYGLPGSGKSTWSKQYCKENKDWVRISRDDLRHMRGEYWQPKDEDLITNWEHTLIYWALTAGKNVVVDATHLNPKYIENHKEKIKELFADTEFETKRFDTPLEECIKRDLLRPNSVGEKVIRQMYEKWLAPPVEPYKGNPNLPDAVIFDIDGTLAKMNGRTPFQWDKVGTDLCNEPIARLARLYWGTAIRVIIFSGRDGCCLQDTQEWLLDNNILFDELHMRDAGNFEKDTVIKKRMFEEHVRHRYNVLLVVDDRDSVVNMWRKELGLTCLQVDYGDF